MLSTYTTEVSSSTVAERALPRSLDSTSPQQSGAPPKECRSASVPSSPPPPRAGQDVEARAMDRWFQDLQSHEATLKAMASAVMDAKFKEELGMIEQWFTVLAEAERTATVYALMQHSSPTQIRFFAAILQEMIEADNLNEIHSSLEASLDGQSRRKQSLRPPSLDLPNVNSPSVVPFNTPASALSFNSAMRSAATVPSELSSRSDSARIATPGTSSWANMVATPEFSMFPKSSNSYSPLIVPQSAGASQLDPKTLQLLGIGSEAQLLALQLVMSGQFPALQNPKRPSPLHKLNGQQQRARKGGYGLSSDNWRGPPSSKYPSSALRSSGFKTSPLKSSTSEASAGAKTASSTGSSGTPQEAEFDPEILKDVPAWLRSVRLHKYTACFEGMTWQEMVDLTEPQLQEKGVVAQGARGRMLKIFQFVKTRMGLAPEAEESKKDEHPASAAIPSEGAAPISPGHDRVVPHSAAPAISVGA